MGSLKPTEVLSANTPGFAVWFSAGIFLHESQIQDKLANVQFAVHFCRNSGLHKGIPLQNAICFPQFYVKVTFLSMHCYFFYCILPSLLFFMLPG